MKELRIAGFRLIEVEPNVWEIPKGSRPGMRVPARIFASEILLEKMGRDRTLEQATNVARLPGIQKYSIVMPDGHQGYGFPIGGVAGIDAENGVISPGGIGFDINCGVRVIRTDLTEREVRPKLRQLLKKIFEYVPAGVGLEGRIKLSKRDLDEVLERGVDRAIEHGYAREEDKRRTEEGGRMKDADPTKVSERAKRRGRGQLGTLGAGNHFLEIQIVDQVYNEEVAKKFGIFGSEDGSPQVLVMIHTGSRGLGHQVASDYLRIMEREMRRYNLRPPDRELACVPFNSPVGQDYRKAMSAAANFAFTNRTLIMYRVRKAFEEVFGTSAEDLGMHLIYDVAHNIAKLEEHEVDGRRMKILVHRKGATRAFPKGHEALKNTPYYDVGQPVLIPGSMGTASYILVGTETSMKKTFGSSAHGAGRMMSRAEAIRKFRGSRVKREMERMGILVMSGSLKGLAEERAPAYKNVDEVVRVTDSVGIAKKVVRMRPIGVVKG